MLPSIPSKTFMALFMGLFCLLVSCGKKAETTENMPEQTRPPITNDFLEKQSVSCEGNQACPPYIAKIVTIQGGQAKYCTGFLTNDNVVATSTSCLPDILRLSGQDCSKDVFFYFPSSSYRPLERANCVKVLQASQLIGKDPVLWRDDVTFLSISESMEHRRHPEISREGIQDGKEYYVWGLEQQDKYSGFIKKFKCESIHNNYINPLVENPSSPNMLFANCPLPPESSGAPVIVYSRWNRISVRSIISKSIDSNLRNYLQSSGLLVQGLKTMFHATNFACAPTLNDTDMLDEVECMKDLTMLKVDGLRSNMLSMELLFSDLQDKFEASLDKISSHVNFGVKFINQGDVQSSVVVPKCFKPLRGWLGAFGNRSTYVTEIKIPMASFKRTMDPDGRLQGTELNTSEKSYFIQYSLKTLRSSKKSSILMWNNDEDLQVYSGLTDECSSLF